MIVFHHNDADGRCAAAVAKLWFDRERSAKNPQAMREGSCVVFVELDYKDRVPVERIDRSDTVVIVDFSFPPAVMGAVQRATDIGVIWCDHHVTAKDYGYNVPGIRDFSDKGLSGCECACRFFFPGHDMPFFVRLLGDYDAWRMQHRELSLPFYEGLKLENQSPEDGIWQDLFDDPGVLEMNRIVEQGKSAIKYRDVYCAEIRKAFGYETTIASVRAYAMNAYRFGSLGHGEKFSEYPVCIAYIHDGNRFTVSLYSETVDVGAIAKQFGGGGHKGAAGFVCETLPFHA